MKHATLRQLKVFEAVARRLSFSRAAEELHLTQPAVSTQVRKLDAHADNPLVEQFGKKIYLTPAGTELLHISRAIIQQFEAGEHAMTQFKGISGGKLDVPGFPLMLHWYVVRRRSKRLPPVAQAFKDFLLNDGAALISRIVLFDSSTDTD